MKSAIRREVEITRVSCDSGLAGARPSNFARENFGIVGSLGRIAGFTLIEIVIAVFITLLLLGLAVPSLNGVLADRRLHRSLDRFNDLVRQAHERSLAERRAYLIVVDDRGASLQPVAFLKNEEHKAIDTVQVASGETWRMDLPAALIKNAPAQWIFWESGACEPARISFAGADGRWVAEYSPLSALAQIISYVPR
jgi:type II secretory pathway pseudopilin PulG